MAVPEEINADMLAFWNGKGATPGWLDRSTPTSRSRR